MKHILSASQFTPEQMGEFFTQADEYKRLDETNRGRRQVVSTHLGEQICALFYAPSTRTRLSFETAAAKLGMFPVGTENAGEFSSAVKGESIEDTIRVLSEYKYSAIVVRSEDVGDVAKGAEVSQVPVINAGDGPGEHPTQALLDAYTIQEQHGRLNNLKIVMGGDLKNGRTVRSLSQVLAKYPDNHISFVSMPELQIGEDIKTILDDHKTSHEETSDMYGALHDADVVYWTRLQKEHIENPEAIPEGGFVIDRVALEALPEHATIMHPLPRVGEIDTTIDHDPRAVYFKQAGNGLFIRMAILDKVIIRK